MVSLLINIYNRNQLQETKKLNRKQPQKWLNNNTSELHEVDSIKNGFYIYISTL